MKKAPLVFFLFVAGIFTGYGQDARQTLEDLNRIIAREPGNATLYRMRGTIYARSGQNREALVDFNQAVSLDANNVDNLSTRGLFYGQLKMFQEALKDFISITIIDPENDRAYCLASRSFRQLGKYNDSFFFINMAIEFNRNEAAYYSDRAVLYLSSNQLDSALSDINRAIELAPDANFYTSRCEVYLRLAKQAKNKKQKTEYEKKAKEDFEMAEKLGGGIK
jgi:tetratricopeptide (TPR) repeat protein